MTDIGRFIYKIIQLVLQFLNNYCLTPPKLIGQLIDDCIYTLCT